MKISCMAALAPPESLTEKAGFLAKAGFDAMEVVAAPDDLEAMAPELRAILQRGEIGISAICALHRGWVIDPDPEARQAALEDLRSLLTQAGELGGVPVFIIPILGYTLALPGGSSTGRSQAEDREVLVGALARLAEHAEKVGSEILLEVINRYEAPVGNTLAECAALVQQVSSPACAMLPDFFHMNIEEAALPAALYQNCAQIGHVHAGDSKRTFPGFGHLNYAALIQALVAGDYQGYLTVDAGDPRLDASAILPRVRAFLRATIETARQRADL